MRFHRCSGFACMMLIVAFDFSSSRFNAETPEVELAGRSISMDLVTDDDDLTLTAWPDEKVTLATDAVTVKRGDNIADLLKARGIRPDVESYTLVYDLNPKLEKVDPLPIGANLTLPKVIGREQMRQQFASGHIVMLTVDKQLKDKLKNNADEIRSLSPRFLALESSRFADPGRRQEAIKSVKDLAKWFEHIRKTFAQRTARPVRRVTLLQAADESAVLRLMLEQALAPGQKLSRRNQDQISAIHKDIEEMIGKWDEHMAGELPPGEPQYIVEVEIRSDDASRVRNLRVYYVVAGLFRKPIINPPVRSVGFAGLGSGSSAMLPVKNYKIWAAQDGAPANPATAITDLPVRKPATGNSIKLVLSLLH